MRFDDQRESDNIEDQRGSGGGGGGFGFGGGGGGGMLPGLIGMLLGGRSLGCGGILVIGALLLFAGGGLGGLGGMLGGGGSAPEAQVEQPQIGFPGAETQPAADTAQGASKTQTELDRFTRKALGSTEDVWTRLFPEQAGRAYPAPTLVLFSGRGRSACGQAESAMGPFYCPADRKLYLDQQFFSELNQRFGAPGDAAAVYVIAHEVGHHIQTVLGISEQVQQAQSRGSTRQNNALQVRMELQADCLAGVYAKASGQLEAGDIEEAVTAAQAIGDDTLQRQSRGTVVPDSFTHGSSAQRVEWLKRGLAGGTIEGCDTFANGAV